MGQGNYFNPAGQFPLSFLSSPLVLNLHSHYTRERPGSSTKRTKDSWNTHLFLVFSTHWNNMSVAFQKKFLNPWTPGTFQRTPVFEELQMKTLPVLMSVELTCSKINGPMKVKNKEKEKASPTKNNFGFCNRKSLILIVYRKINLTLSLDIKKGQL